MKTQSKVPAENVGVQPHSSTNGHRQKDAPRHNNKDSIKDIIANGAPPSVNDDKSPAPNTTPAPKEPLSYAERRQLMIDFGKELSKVPGIRVQTEEELCEENRYYRFYGDPDSDHGKD